MNYALILFIAKIAIFSLLILSIGVQYKRARRRDKLIASQQETIGIRNRTIDQLQKYQR